MYTISIGHVNGLYKLECPSSWSMCILNKGHTDGFMTKLCFGDGDVYVDLTLLNIIAALLNLAQ